MNWQLAIIQHWRKIKYFSLGEEEEREVDASLDMFLYLADSIPTTINWSKSTLLSIVLIYLLATSKAVRVSGRQSYFCLHVSHHHPLYY